MIARAGTLAAVAALLLSLPASARQAQEPEQQPAETPRQIGLEERVGRRLVQLDVTVSGPPDAIVGLTADDFELVIGLRRYEEFLVDSLCHPEDAEETLFPPEATVADGADGADAVDSAPLPVPRRPRASYLFYFDMENLTLEGRQNSLNTARELVRELIVGGDRAMIISSGRDTRVFAELTDDPAVLIESLKLLERDPLHWSTWAEEEELRISEVLRDLERDIDRAESTARRFQKEERWHTERSFRRFSTVLPQLAGHDPPKIVVYFADTTRKNAGQHYLNFFKFDTAEPVLVAGATDSFTAQNPFDDLVAEAAANGIRFYTVQGRGMTVQSTIRSRSYARTETRFTNEKHTQDAQGTLVGMANETGGEAFLNGVRGAKIARRIHDDLACVYLVSFDPQGLPLDAPLPVKLKVSRPGVKLRVRGQIVVQSESRRDLSRLLAAFAAPSDPASGSVRGVVVPLGYADGMFSALVQIIIPPSPLSAVEWDVGASLVSRSAVRADAAEHVSLSGPGASVVVESEMRFKPGPFELILVAHENRTDQIVTGRLEGSFPDLNAEPVTFGPVALMQPATAAFVRDGEHRADGALGRADGETVHPARPTALVSIVCREKGKARPYRVERRVVGDSEAQFPSLQLDLGQERCALFQDLIPAGTMTSGAFDYEVQVFDSVDRELGSTHRRFIVVDPAEFGAPGT